MNDTTTRLRQGLRALLARQERVSLPARYADGLPERVVAAWNRLSPYDQHHLLAVADDLRCSRAPQTVVLAGVLHDIGKGGDTSVFARSTVVLLKRFAPAAARSLRDTSAPPRGLKGIHLLLAHADTGARLLESCGVRQEVVWLVRHHESTSSHPYLRALQEADHRH